MQPSADRTPHSKRRPSQRDWRCHRPRYRRDDLRPNDLGWPLRREIGCPHSLGTTSACRFIVLLGPSACWGGSCWEVFRLAKCDTVLSSATDSGLAPSNDQASIGSSPTLVCRIVLQASRQYCPPRTTCFGYRVNSAPSYRFAPFRDPDPESLVKKTGPKLA